MRARESILFRLDVSYIVSDYIRASGFVQYLEREISGLLYQYLWFYTGLGAVEYTVWQLLRNFRIITSRFDSLRNTPYTVVFVVS